MVSTKNVFDSISGAYMLSSCDIFQSFFQIGLQKDSRKDTGVHVHGKRLGGVFEIYRCSDGLHNSLQHFQRRIELVLAGMRYLCAMWYVNGIITYSPSVEQHLRDLEDVYVAFADWVVQCSRKQAFMCSQCLRFFGHVLSKDGKHTYATKSSRSYTVTRRSQVKMCSLLSAWRASTASNSSISLILRADASSYL